MSVQQKEIGMN